MNRNILVSAVMITTFTITFSVSSIFAQGGNHRAGSGNGNRTGNGNGSGNIEQVQSNNSNEIRGRDIAAGGTLMTLSGTLEEMDAEWYLNSGSNVYALHIGNHEFRDKTGIKLETGKRASVKGFAKGVDVAVATVEMDGKEYKFRGDDGRPEWVGQGNGRNRTSH